MAGLFLLPIIASLVWILFLHLCGVPFNQGRKGFLVILAISGGLIAILTILLWVTSGQHQAY